MERERVLTILLVEADYSLRRLIALGLQHRGIGVVEVSSPGMLPSLDTRQIDLLLLDVDCSTRSDWSFLDAVELYPALSSVPVVVLAWDKQPVAGLALSPTANVVLTRATYLTKPFDARILHKTIDHLLAAQALAEATVEAEQEAVLLASYNRQTTPSIWPIITAAGVLIAVTGMLLQFVIAVLGFLIVIVALLLWTLGSNQEANRVALS